MSANDVRLPVAARSERPSLRSRVAIGLGLPSARESGSWAGRAGGVLLALGVLAVSWDRLANVPLGPYNVKAPSLLLSLAFVLALLVPGAVRERWGQVPWVRAVVLLAAGVVVVLAIRGALTPNPVAAAGQVVAVLTGAVLPAFAVLLLVRTRADLVWLLRWFLAGTALACAFGLYQLLAFYLHWPQGIDYAGTSIGSGLGRITAFNYEPAYFTYFLVLSMGVAAGLARLQGRRLPWLTLIGLALVIYLANARAASLVVLALGALLLVDLRRDRRLPLQVLGVGAGLLLLALVTPTAVGLVQQWTAPAAEAAPAPSEAATADGGVAPAPSESARASSEAPPPSALQAVDPAEQSSNAPRLHLYGLVLDVVRSSPLVGVGAGNLGPALMRADPVFVQTQQGAQVVANNVWLQALADGGVVLLLVEGALLVVVALAALRARSSSALPILAAWAAVLLVGGMLTSYYFDIKLWVVLALGVAALQQGRSQHARELP